MYCPDRLADIDHIMYCPDHLADIDQIMTRLDKFRQVYLFYNQKIIDPCGTYIQSQVNTGINIGIIYNLLT